MTNSTQSIVDTIDGTLQELALQEETARKNLDEIQSEIKRLTKARTVLMNGTVQKTKPARTTNVTSKRSSDRVLKTVLDAMKQHPDQEWSTEDVMVATDLGGSTISTAVRDLRTDGAIDLVRRGGKTGAKAFYKVAMTDASVT